MRRKVAVSVHVRLEQILQLVAVQHFSKLHFYKPAASGNASRDKAADQAIQQAVKLSFLFLRIAVPVVSGLFDAMECAVRVVGRFLEWLVTVHDSDEK